MKHTYIYDYICTSPYLHVYSEIKATNSKRLEATQKGYCPASTPVFSGCQVTRWYWNEVLQLAADTHTISYLVLNPAKPFVFVESTYVLAKKFLVLQPRCTKIFSAFLAVSPASPRHTRSGRCAWIPGPEKRVERLKGDVKLRV